MFASSFRNELGLGYFGKQQWHFHFNSYFPKLLSPLLAYTFRIDNFHQFRQVLGCMEKSDGQVEKVDPFAYHVLKSCSSCIQVHHCVNYRFGSDHTVHLNVYQLTHSKINTGEYGILKNKTGHVQKVDKVRWSLMSSVLRLLYVYIFLSHA